VFFRSHCSKKSIIFFNFCHIFIPADSDLVVCMFVYMFYCATILISLNGSTIVSLTLTSALVYVADSSSSSDSSSSESSYSNVANGFGWEKREVRQGWMTVWGRGNVV
jgi:hypothetical protein